MNKFLKNTLIAIGGAAAGYGFRAAQDNGYLDGAKELILSPFKKKDKDEKESSSEKKEEEEPKKDGEGFEETK